MKPKTITLRKKFNLGNFEMEDIEISMELDEGDDLDEVFQLVKQKIIYLHSIDCKEVTQFKMNIKEFATAYEPQKMKLISDLDSVKADIEFKTEVREDREKKKYTVNFIVVDEVEYRVPISVVEQLKGILEAKPDLTTFKVSKTGDGMATKYQVIPL